MKELEIRLPQSHLTTLLWASGVVGACFGFMAGLLLGWMT